MAASVNNALGGCQAAAGVRENVWQAFNTDKTPPECMRRLIDAVATDPKRSWNDSTRNQFEIDANAILEALLLEYGVNAALAAVVKQGFSPRGEYRYAAEPLHEKAVERRAKRLAKRAGNESGAESRKGPRGSSNRGREKRSGVG